MSESQSKTKKDAWLTIKPFATGGRSHDQVIVRRADAPVYLCLSTAEYDAVLQLSEQKFSVQEWLASHLGTHQGLAFSAAVELLLKLHQNDFLQHASPESVEALKKALVTVPQTTPNKFTSTIRKLTGLADIALLRFENTHVHHGIIAITSTLKKRPVAIAFAMVMLLTFLGSAWILMENAAGILETNWTNLLFAAPEALLGKVILGIALSSSTLALLQLLYLGGQRLTFLPSSLHLTAFAIPNFRINDNDAWMLFRTQARLYRVVALTMPWFFAVVTYAASIYVQGEQQSTSFLTVLAFGFALNGALNICPLFRGTLVRAIEGMLASTSIHHATIEYLSKGLITDLFRDFFRNKKSIDDRGKGSSKHDNQVDGWAAALATFSLAWLYGAWLLTSNALLEGLPSLAYHATAWQHPLRALSASTLIAAASGAALLVLLKLLEIPLTNLTAAAAIPLRKVRRGVLEYKTPNLSPNEAIIQFLKNIPLLGQLSDEALASLISTMKLLRLKAGENIITQGEEGREFFILADGEAKVMHESVKREVRVLDVLLPGDSFGEIALLQKGRRTASVRITEDAKVLAIPVSAFDKLFPEGSPERSGLTTMLRHMKTVQDSQALSHLPPRQIRELVSAAKTVNFAMGDTVIQEGTSGDACYLIESGSMQVTKQGREGFRVELSRGSLVGAIALVNDSARTATVTAMEDCVCLRIDKDLFLKMCLSNVLVASLIADMASAQLAEQEDVRLKARANESRVAMERGA